VRVVTQSITRHGTQSDARDFGSISHLTTIGHIAARGAKVPGTLIAGSLSVVTGASSGIGDATARALAARGSHVLLLARNGDRLHSVADEIRGRGGQADAFAVDLSDPKAIAAVAQRLVATHGSPHILINNAGAGRWLPILETPAEEVAQMMAVPYLAAFNITRELLPGMLARRSGHIVNVTSVAARLAWPGAVAYTAARAAMEGFTNALRADLYGSGLQVTLAMFGTVETPYWDHNPGSRERMPRQAARMPTLTPERVAAAIVAAIEKGSRTVVAPARFRLLFLLNRLFPRQTEASMCRVS
jgi:short-subunit dehydrogenase